MKEIRVIQGSPEWWALRRGIPTASEFSRILTNGGEVSKSSIGYAAELIAEGLGWEKSGFRGSPDIERGVQMEPEARRWLAYRAKQEVRPAGFCLSDSGFYGASPDALLEDGITPVEIKCPDLHTFIKWRMAGSVLPTEHRLQVHGEMLVTGADKCIFVAYVRELPPMAIKVCRTAFTDSLGTALNLFCEQLEDKRREILGDQYREYRSNMAAARADAIASITNPQPPAPARNERLGDAINRFHREIRQEAI